MKPGSPDLLGATYTGEGVNFAIQSRAATRVDVCLFDSTGRNEVARLTLPGKTGAVHHGFMDQAFLRPLPGMVLMAPSDEAELNRSLRFALSLETVSAVRYPRDNVPTCNFEDIIDQPLRECASQEWKLGKSRTLREGSDSTLIVYGALMEAAFAAAEMLQAEGIDVAIIDARFCKPVDGASPGSV